MRHGRDKNEAETHRRFCLHGHANSCMLVEMVRKTSFSVSEVAELARAKPRSVQYWAAEGILRPDPGTASGGRGVHRTFPPSEVRVAAVAAVLGKLSMSAPMLKSVCEHVRPVIAPESAPPEPSTQLPAMRALQAGEPVYMTVEVSRELGHVSFIEPNRHDVDWEILFEVYGPFFVGLVDLRAVLKGLP